MGESINLINRIIIPILTQPSFVEDKSTTGLADISYTAWLSPTKASKITWGVGPVFQIGKLPVNFNAQIYYNAVKPDGFGDVQTRFQLQFLFPKK